MRFFAIAFVVSVVLAGRAFAAPGAPRLIQGTLEWPPALSGGEPFIVLRGDDDRVYYADVMSAQRYVLGALSAGSHITVLGLEGTRPHEIIAVALGSGDAATLSFALAQATPGVPTPPPQPSTAPAGVVPPAPTTAPAAVSPARREEGSPARGQEGRSITLRGSVYAVMGPTLLLKRDDGRVVVVDIARLDPSTGLRLRLGSPVTVVAVPVGNKFQATGLTETETGTSGSTPAKPGR